MMIDKIGRAAMYELLAEECSELAQMALKAARLERQENPCGMTPKEVYAGLREETTDVFLCMTELKLYMDPDIFRQKVTRFNKRWEEFKNGADSTESGDSGSDLTGRDGGTQEA